MQTVKTENNAQFKNESTTQFVDKAVLRNATHAANDTMYSKKPYIVISAVQGEDLENNVEVWMKEGYCAQGGLSVSEGIYYQAMTLVH